MFDVVVYNGKITTLDPRNPEVSAMGIANGLVARLGTDDELLKEAGASTRSCAAVSRSTKGIRPTFSKAGNPSYRTILL